MSIYTTLLRLFHLKLFSEHFILIFELQKYYLTRLFSLQLRMIFIEVLYTVVYLILQRSSCFSH